MILRIQKIHLFVCILCKRGLKLSCKYKNQIQNNTNNLFYHTQARRIMYLFSYIF